MVFRGVVALPDPSNTARANPDDPPPLEPLELAAALGLSRTAAQLLWRRGYTEPQRARGFLEPKLSQLTPPDSMADRARAAKRLAAAIRARERIFVFGDYDCDGITSAAIMTHALRTLGADPQVALANRFEGGYGVTLAAAERIRAANPALLVTCDCGSSDAESLRLLAQSGVQSIVIDHHLVPSEPLPAVAFLNPHRPECGFSYKHLASCGLALSVVAALRAELDVKLDLHAYLDLVAVGTIADVAPLDGDNRILVRAGLRRLSESPRPGLKALLDRARIEPGVCVSGEDVAFRIAPRLNAPGRLGPPDVSLRLLLTEDAADAEQLADAIETLQQQRRQLQDTMVAEAHEEIEARGWGKDAGIVIGRESWSSGIVGIVAGKLADHYRRPVIAIGVDGQGGHGSVRGPRGVPLYDILQGLSDCLVRFGGHQAAAGLDVRTEAIDELRRRFAEACAADTGSSAAGGEREDPGALPIDSDDDVYQVARDLSLFEPCGEGNRQPLLIARGQVVRARAVRGGHLQLELTTPSGQSLRAFGFGLGDSADDLTGEAEILGTIRVTRYQSVERAEMRIERLSLDPAGQGAAAP